MFSKFILFSGIVLFSQMTNLQGSVITLSQVTVRQGIGFSNSQMFSNNGTNTEISRDSIEVFIIDAFVPPEASDIFTLTFYTSDLCKSAIMLDGKYLIPISEKATDNHRAEINLAQYKFGKELIPYYIIVEDESGNKWNSEAYDIEIRKELVVESSGSNFFSCLMGGIVFLTPNIAYINGHGENYFRLRKELPLFTFHSGGYNYPSGAFMFGYAHTFNFKPNNVLLYGYRHFIEIPVFEYISPYAGGYSNFKGINGASAELSLGLLKIYNVFSIEACGRYSLQPGVKGSEFWEISLGLFSSFFTLNL